MKQFLKTTVAVLLAITITSCGRDNDEASTGLNSNRVIKDFTLEKTKVEVSREEQIKVKITSGNGEYKINYISPEGHQAAKIEITPDNQYIEITGIKEGASINASITDVRAGKTINLAIFVPISHAKPLERPDFGIKDPQVYIDKTNALIKEYERLTKELEKYPALPDSDLYKQQTEAWKGSLSFIPQRIEKFKGYTKDMSLDVIKEDYKIIYTQGVGYAYVELLSRRGAEYQKQFPDDTEILNFIKQVTLGNYTTQEGGEFAIGFNKETLKNFNLLVDRFNELKRKQ